MNVVCHFGALWALLVLGMEDGCVVLWVCDDGCGLLVDVGVLLNGICGMCECVMLIGVWFELIGLFGMEVCLML